MEHFEKVIFFLLAFRGFGVIVVTALELFHMPISKHFSLHLPVSRSMRSLAILTVLTVGSAAVVAGPLPDLTSRGSSLQSNVKPLLGLNRQKVAFVPNRVLVAFKPSANRAMVSSPAFGLVPNTAISSPYFTAYDIVAPGMTVDQAITALRANPSVRIAEPDFYVHSMQAPNDPLFGDLWGLNNTGQAGGVAGADIDILLAWKKQKGKPAIKVAVIDTGVDYTHEDLAANILKKNGHVVGYDFANNDSDPMDDFGHGTHCSGTIAARRGNNLGVAGVAPGVKIMPVKFLGSSGGGTLSGAIEAIDFARENGATIMSNSWGGYGYSYFLYEACARANDAGIVFVAASGNAGISVDDTPMFPAGFNRFLPNIISVAATDRSDTIASFSNYGDSVDVAAPGVDILSTVPGNGYELNSGTSMAAPHVSGAMALILSEFPDISIAAAKDRLIRGADHLANLLHYTKTAGRLNANNALETDLIPPGSITNFVGVQRSSSAVSYSFVSPGDDGNSGKASYFDVRYSYKPITEANFLAATQAGVQATNVSNGGTVKFAITGLVPSASRKVYVAARAVDNVSNPGPVLIGPIVQLLAPIWLDSAETTAKWTASGGFGLTTEQAVSGTHSWADSPGGAYQNNANAVLLQADSVAATGPMLVYFNLNYQIETNYDNLMLDVSYNNGATWSSLSNYTGYSGGWSAQTLYVPAAAGNNVKLRFTFTSDSTVSFDGCYIDDVRFVPASLVFNDNVESSPQFTGTAPFAVTTEQAASPTHSWTDSIGGNYADNTDATLTSNNVFDASALLPAIVKFKAMTDLEYGFDFTTLDVSDNGGPYRSFVRLTGTTPWMGYSADVSNTSRLNLRPRFHFTSDYIFNYNGVYLDDIQVVGEAAQPVP